jgi:dienelactone hydrolase
MGLFGTHDDSIPATDRQAINSKLTAAGIPTLMKEYDAGHAFFNADRADRYSQPAATQAWQDLKSWLLT